MNLSEFSLNLFLASLVMLIALSCISSISFHSDQLTQKINLEDNALRALITLDQAIKSSSLTYCAPLNSIINNTGNNINTDSRYQWHNKSLTTYQKGPAQYLNTDLSAKQATLTLPNDVSINGTWLILDDCHHTVLSQIINPDTKQKTLNLHQALGVDLHPPIMIGTLNIAQFYINNQNLYLKIADDNSALIYPNIKNINIDSKHISLTTQIQDHDFSLQKDL